MKTIEIETPDGPIDALLSIPAGEGPWPGVVVIHDAIGYGPDKQSTNDHIARAGYAALTPNMYSRGGRVLHHPSHAGADDAARPRT
jgi:carboxymethylenebutenolidase